MFGFNDKNKNINCDNKLGEAWMSITKAGIQKGRLKISKQYLEKCGALDSEGNYNLVMVKRKDAMHGLTSDFVIFNYKENYSK